mmetsp:Transcript_49234/g.117147  ORF Transcript_49234/g.117147 Transcript_49234/m.117147 type:complete len:216 (-) Transcript_49234:547-1194(-)
MPLSGMDSELPSKFLTLNGEPLRRQFCHWSAMFLPAIRTRALAHARSYGWDRSREKSPWMSAGSIGQCLDLASKLQFSNTSFRSAPKASMSLNMSLAPIGPRGLSDSCRFVITSLVRTFSAMTMVFRSSRLLCDRSNSSSTTFFSNTPAQTSKALLPPTPFHARFNLRRVRLSTSARPRAAAPTPRIAFHDRSRYSKLRVSSIAAAIASEPEEVM